MRSGSVAAVHTRATSERMSGDPRRERTGYLNPLRATQRSRFFLGITPLTRPSACL